MFLKLIQALRAAPVRLPKKTLKASLSYACKNQDGGLCESFCDPFAFIPTCCCADGCTNFYDSRKFSPCLPDCCPDRVDFETPCNMPCGVFRFTKGEVLGPGAGKGANYKNPEYYSYHNNSFYDTHIYLSRERNPTPDSRRKP